MHPYDLCHLLHLVNQVILSTLSMLKPVSDTSQQRICQSIILHWQDCSLCTGPSGSSSGPHQRMQLPEHSTLIAACVSRGPPSCPAAATLFARGSICQLSAIRVSDPSRRSESMIVGRNKWRGRSCCGGTSGGVTGAPHEIRSRRAGAHQRPARVRAARVRGPKERRARTVPESARRRMHGVQFHRPERLTRSSG